MRSPIRFCCLLFLLTLPSLASADCVGIPYCNIGQVAPEFTLVAAKTGDLMGQYYGHIADFVDYVRIIDVTSNVTGPWVFNNQTTNPGDKADFGFVTAGDRLILEIWDTGTNHIYANNPAYSDDQVNHAYAYGGVFINSFTPIVFFGMEDLQENEQTDWDYNDSEFFLFNVLISKANLDNPADNTPTPEPASLLLAGTSLVMLGRKLTRH